MLVLVVGLVLTLVLTRDDGGVDRAGSRATDESSTIPDDTAAPSDETDETDDPDTAPPADGDYVLDEDTTSLSGVTGDDGTATVTLNPPSTESLTIEVAGASDLVLSTIDIDTDSEIRSDETTGGTESIEIVTLSTDPWTITVSDYSDLAGQEFTISYS